MRRISKLVLALGVVYLQSIGASAAFDRLSSSIDFHESSTDTPNPDRGMFRQIRVDNSLRFAPPSLEVKNYRLDFALDHFIAQAIPDEEMKNLDQSLAAMDRAGQRAIVRFIYDYPPSDLVKSGLSARHALTATRSVMSTHIRQLSGVIRRHTKAVFAVESGMIGFWGEQHGDTLDKQTPSGVAALVDQWRVALKGTEIQVLARYPKALREYVQRNPDSLHHQPRLGFWNDCLGAYDDGNMGAPAVAVIEGETCSLRPRVNYSCPIMTAYFRSIQLDLLHSRYYMPTIKRWGAEGCLDQIRLYLGYRYVIRQARLATDNSQLELQIDNVGWGRSHISRPLYLVSNGRRLKRIADLESFAPGSVNHIHVGLDASVNWGATKLTLETTDGVRFSNTTGNLLFAPPSVR